MAKAKLFCKAGTFKDREFSIEESATVGRSNANTIELAHGSISGRHARIEFDTAQGCFVLEDAGSSNGTWLDGKRVSDRQRLGHLHIIGFAEEEFIFHDTRGCSGAPARPAKAETKPSEPRQAETRPAPPRQPPANRTIIEPPRESPAGKTIIEPPRESPAGKTIIEPPRESPAGKTIIEPPAKKERSDTGEGE